MNPSQPQRLAIKVSNAEEQNKEDPTLLARRSLNILLRVLCKKVPLEIALQIVDAAEIHPCSILGSRGRLERETYSLISGKRVYLTAQIPFYDNVRELKNFKLPLSTSIPRRPLSRIVDKLVFKFSIGCWSPVHPPGGMAFLEVELWRRKYEGYQQDIQANLQKQMSQIEQDGGKVSDLDQNYCIASRSSEIHDKEYHDYYHGYSKGGPQEETKGPIGKFRVGCWFLFRIHYPRYEIQTEEVEWNWRRDEPPYVGSDGGRAKLGSGGRANGRFFQPWDCKEKKTENGRFIRELREGDEVKVVMRSVKGIYDAVLTSCEVECWWKR
ncbi:hypothetical protein TWF506_003580 [Arthrobotrys conoides]|uniref:Uncharacterized protein n=1 Tax=Arthrobotrys conoides TaxID=74498 RepID=A0AAN8MXT5_9PEZI